MAFGEFMTTAKNRDYSKWWQEEGSFPWMFQQPKPPIENEAERPISTIENYERCVRGEQPYWMPDYMGERDIIWPDAMEEHPVPEVDGFDWWGVEWKMEPNIGGMITKPGTRVIQDFANWKEEVPWPDLSVVDFETDGKKIQTMLDPARPHVYECVEGITERLHEMMPFDEALAMLYEEPELMDEFFEKMCDYKIESCTKIFEYYGRVDGVLYHDDWGTQRSGFYSNEMFREQIMPATTRFLSFLKEQGKFIELHSCGKNIQYVPEMVEMGIDMWTPQNNNNDPYELYEKYGDVMTFCFWLPLDSAWSEEETRSAVRKFVDDFGAKGRCMPWLMGDMENPNPQVEAWARDELYTYSLDYYNRLYGRA